MVQIGPFNTYTPVFTGSLSNPSGGSQTNALARWARMDTVAFFICLDVTYAGWSGGSGDFRISLPNNASMSSFQLFDFNNGLNCILRSGSTVLARTARIATSTSLRFITDSGNTLQWSDLSSGSGFTLSLSILWPIHIPI